MPTYDYQCSQCGHQLEIFHKISETPSHECPKCHKETLGKKPGAGIGLSFQGDGFYQTMYGKGDTAPRTAGGCCPCGKNKTDCSS